MPIRLDPRILDHLSYQLLTFSVQTVFFATMLTLNSASRKGHRNWHYLRLQSRKNEILKYDLEPASQSSFPDDEKALTLAENRHRYIVDTAVTHSSSVTSQNQLKFTAPKLRHAVKLANLTSSSTLRWK